MASTSMEPEIYMRSSGSVSGVIGFTVSLIVFATGIFAAPYSVIGVVIAAFALLSMILGIVGFVWPFETGCSVDQDELRWWSKRFVTRANHVALRDIQSADRVNLDGSWIEVVTVNGDKYSISDSFTGGSARIYEALRSRLASLKSR